MDVYLVPLGGNRYELYAEFTSPAADDGPRAEGARRSWWQRQSDRFQAMIAEAEAERARILRGESSQQRGVGRWVMGRIADAIVEQRMLWHLRHLTEARLAHPAALQGSAALALARALFLQDYGKHRRWCAIDTGIACVTGPVFFFVPGPNVLSWYFAFRAAGHFFALRGAGRGLSGVRWQTQASSDLDAVHDAIRLEPAERRARLSQLAAALGLTHLASFVDRAVARSS